jgi:uncharacterized protein
MAGNGWGGARPNSGPKPRRRPEEKRNPFARPAAPPTKSFLPSFSDVAALVEASKSHARSQERTAANNPFRIYAHPDPAMPPKERQMAMDNALVSQMDWASKAWLAGDIFSGVAAEGLMFLGYPYLSELAQRPEYRTISEIIADDATRKWIDFEVVGGKKAKKARDAGEEPDPDDLEDDRKENGKDEKVKAIQDELVRLEAQDRFYCLCRNDGFFGRSHLYMNFGEDLDGDPKELAIPIGDGRSEMSRAKADGKKLQKLQVVEPVWTYPQQYNAVNPLLDTWYSPQQWYVMGKEIHRSRLLTVIGRPVPDMLKPAYSFGGLSLSQIAKPYVDNWLRTRTSVGELIHAFSVMVLSTDLQTILQPGNATNLLARVALFNALRDNQGAFVINKTTEDFKNVSASLSTLDTLQAQSQEHICSVSRIPLVKYTGISPQGLNASSEGEIMVYDDTIAAYQNRVIRPDLTTVVNFVQTCLFKEVDPEITLVFQKLREMTEEETAELQKKKAERDEVYVNMGAIDAGEVRRVIVNDPDLPFSGLDPDDVPEPPQQEQMGGPGGGGNGGGGGGPDALFGGGEGGGANDAVVPFARDAAPWNESDHPRAPDGKFGKGSGGGGGGGGGGEKQKLRMPQFGLTATPREAHQPKAETGGEFFQQNWHKAGSVGGHSQPTASQIEAYLNAYENQGEPSAPKGPAPLQPKDLKRVGKQMGSNPGGVFENAQGERFYVKQGQSPEHVANELAAADLYRLAGARTLEYQPVEGGQHVATRMAKLDKNRATQFSPAEVKAARRDFVTHAWLANWDAVGTGSDNLGTIDGEPTALDLGGALAFRAQGAPKGAAFGDQVTELETMRDPKMSPDAAKVFGGMNEDELYDSAQRVTSIPDEDVRRVIAGRGLPIKIAETLVKRKHAIAQKFGMATDEWLAADSRKEPEHVLHVEYDGDFDAAGLVRHLHRLGAIGASRNVTADDEEERPVTFNWDGDGADKVWSATLDGRDVLAEGLAGDAQWEESKHPRDAGGKFAETAGGGSSGGEQSPEQEWQDAMADIDAGGGTDVEKAEKKIAFAEEFGMEPDDGIIVGSMSDEELDALKEKYGTHDPAEVAKKMGEVAQAEKGLDPATQGAIAAAKEGAGKPKKTAFGGLWKVTGQGEEADYAKNAAIVLGKPANAGQSYRQMVAHLVKQAQKLGLKQDALELKAKLVEAWGKAHAKLIDEYAKAPSDKAPKLLAEAQKIEQKLKEAGAAEAPLKAAVGPSVKSAQDLADVKKYSPKFYEEAVKIAINHAFPGDKESAQKKVIAAVASGDATVAALEVVLSSVEETALTQIYGNLANAYSSVKQTLQKVVKGVAEKTAPTPAPKAEPAPKFPPPTQAELEKAKKSVPLKLEYLGIPNAPSTALTKGLLKNFNDKYEGKALTSQADLAQKVNDFKSLQVAVAKAAGAEQEKALKQQQEQQAAQQAKNKEAAEALKQSQAAAKAKNAEYVKALGISETEATGFDALVQMMGKDSGADVIAQFKGFESQAKKLGLKNVTGFQYALIRNYIDGGYGSINKALRSGSWTPAQHVYARLVNKALDQFPKYTGTVVRGATLDASQIAKYKPGHVVPEASFTSTGKGYKFGGNVHYTIKAIGKRGADFHASGANVGEQEVLFKANTFFLVHSVTTKGGVTHIEMEEVEDHG